MRKWLSPILITVAIAALALAFSEFAKRRSGLEGRIAPDFKGDFAINGQPIRLFDLKGKVVLVDFWAVWCGPCISTFPHLREWHNEFHKDGLEIVGVTMYNQTDQRAEREMLKEFAAKHKLEYLLMPLDDFDFGKMSEAYRVKGFPTVVLIDRKGRVRLVEVGAGDAQSRSLANEIKALIAEPG